MLLNGNDFKNEKFDIILLAGQSNAYGYGVGETVDYKEDDKVLIFDDTFTPYYEKGEDGKDHLIIKDKTDYKISVAKECIGSTGEKVGCFALWFAEEYLKNNLKDDRKLLIVKSAVGGTGFYRHEWTTDGCLYARMCDMLNTALNLNGNNKLVAILWHQGECDAFENADKPTEYISDVYEKNFSVFIGSVREKYGDVPFVAGGFVDEWSSLYKAQCDAVKHATEKVADKLRGGFVETAGLLSNNQKTGNGDNIHFCRESLRIIGKRYYEEYSKLK